MFLTSRLPVLILAYSWDGRYLVSGERGDRASIYVWDLETGCAHLVLEGSSGPIVAVAFSPDGAVLATAAMYENGVRLWDMSSGRLWRVTARRSFGTSSIAFWADGRALASVGSDGMVHLWSVATGGQRVVLDGQASRLNRLAFSADGRIVVASGSGDNHVRFWELTEMILVGMRRPASAFQPQAPPDRIAQQPLIHRVEKCVERVAVGEVAETAEAWLADPAGGGGLAVIRTAPQQEVDTSLVISRRMLFIGHEEGTDAAGDRMGRVDNLDLEPLQRPVADVSASHQVEIRAISRIKSHRVVQVEEPTPALHKRHNRTLLLDVIQMK